MTEKKKNITENKDPRDMNKDKDYKPEALENQDNIEEEEEDDDDGYEILPSNDSGITADDNAATGKLHQREGD